MADINSSLESFVESESLYSVSNSEELIKNIERLVHDHVEFWIIKSRSD